ncbi:MAG: hypothetical protein FJ343_04110 [Sphingomonadales bacterium]|nr:hypothetical protein [Sphingomonadales bacterium]
MISYNGTPSICQGGSTQITMSGGSNYTWSPIIGVSNPNASNPILSPSSTTTYTVIGTDANGCSNSLQITIVVIPPFNVNAGSDRVFCGTPVTLNASASIQGASFQWSNGVNASTNTVSPNTTTSYIVAATNPEGCSYADTVIVYVPTAFAGNNYNICRGGSIQLSGSLAQYPFAGALQYNWTPSTGLSNPGIANPIANPSSTTTYTLTITTPEGCVLSTTTSVVISPTPEIHLGSDFSLAPGSIIQLIPALQYVQPGRTLSWSSIGANPNGSLNLTSIPNPTFTANSVNVATTTRWVLTISNTNGCSGSDTIAITVDPSLSGFLLSGRLQYDNISESPVNDGWAFLIHSNGAKDSVALSPSGSYFFAGLQNGTYRLTTLTNKAYGGITTADASLINTYALGLGSLNGLRLKAADVTPVANNPSFGIFILSNDAQQTARRAADLSISGSFDNGGPGNWYHDTINIVINNQSLVRNIRTISFGDVNASYTPVLRREHLLNIESHGIQYFEPYKELLFPVTPLENLKANSFQFEMELPQGFEVTNARIPGIDEPIYVSQKDRRAMVGWYSIHGLPVDFKPLDPMLVLSLKASNNTYLLNSPSQLSFLARSEIANLAGEEIAAKLSIPKLELKASQGNTEFSLFPNPISPGSAVYLGLPASLSGNIALTLKDGLGRQVATFTKSLNSGQGILDLSEMVNMLSAGKYILQVIPTEGQACKTPLSLPLIIKF